MEQWLIGEFQIIEEQTTKDKPSEPEKEEIIKYEEKGTTKQLFSEEKTLKTEEEDQEKIS